MGIVAALAGQAPQFRVAVDAVRIDAVVTDKDGNVVRDLTADDFEILQDRKPQKVTFAQFVPVGAAPDAREAAAAPRSVPREKAPASPAAPPPVAAAPLKRENVQRTIALVVDDLGLSVESLYYVKRSLHDFIDHSMQPGDLVAIVRTRGSMDGLQPFTTDRRVLHAAVDNLSYYMLSRSHVEAFDAVNTFPMLSMSGRSDIVVGDFSALESTRRTVMAVGTLGALNLVIQGAESLPGRKAILFLSEGFTLLEQDGGDMAAHPGRNRKALDRAVDRATRAGVVIYAIDARGLQTGGLVATDDFNKNCDRDCQDTFDQAVRGSAATRNTLRSDTQTGMKYLAEQTGGFAVLDTNDLGKGLARAAADIRDYYVIGYTPESDTFATNGKPAEFHKLSVRVKRPGLEIRTRTEFLGVSDADQDAAPPSPAQQLVNAAISPFTATDIAVRATTLPGYDAERGLFVRALLHIDTSSLTFARGADGKSAAAADVLGMVFDRDGTEVAHLSTGFEVTLTPQAVQDALHDGLAYTLRIPIRQAGAYQVRFAVRDRASNTYGAAGEFIDLPDVPHGAFAISGIVLRSSDDLVAPADADRMVISPSQAIRVYKAGAQLKYACEIYNAPAPVQLALSVWRGAERVVAGTPDTLTPPSSQQKGFAAGGAFRLGTALPPGRYVLQLAAQTADPAKKGAVWRALQQMDFQVK